MQMLKMPVARAVALCLLVASTHLWASTAGARLHGSKAFHQRQLQGAADGQTLDYWKRLVGTPSRLGGLTKKAGVLPVRKYSMEQFDIIPFQTWLREHTFPLPEGDSGWVDSSRSKGKEDEDGTDDDADYGSNTNSNSNSQARRAAASDLANAASRNHAPLSYVCGVFVNHHYKYIFIRNRKTASSTFITAVRDFMLREKLCNKTADALHPSACLVRLDPDQLLREGRDPDAMWRDYLVLSSSRNPWARAASGYEFTFEKWHQTRAGCGKPTFKQFCRNPYLMGTLSNLFQCVGHREGVGAQYEGHWNFDYYHVEPAAMCMTDDSGRLVVDFMIRYEMLNDDILAAIDLINSRRPAHLPAIEVPLTSMKWRNKGTVAQDNALQDVSDAAYVYADHYRTCGSSCVDPLTDFFEEDLQLFGWDRPGRPPAGEEKGVLLGEGGSSGDGGDADRLRGGDGSSGDAAGDVAK